ncbi:MAG: hypothetical protein ACRD12_19055 [Acidimicrobiales bacterium]
MKTNIVKAFAALAVLALTACGSWSPQRSATDEVCIEVSEMDKSVTELAALPDNATSAQVQQVKAKIDKEYQEVLEEANDSGAQGVDNITSAYNSVQRAISAATSQGVAAARPQIESSAAEVNVARTQYNSSARC